MARAQLARLLVDEGGEPRALWRVLLFVPLFLVADSIFDSLLAPLAARPGLPGAAGLDAAGLLAALAAGAFLLLALDRRTPGALGFAWTREVPREVALGLAITGGALCAVAGGLAFAGELRWTPDSGSPGGYALELARDLLLWGVAAAAEEALFRGYAFQALARGIGPVAATLVASAGFAAAHWRNPNLDVLAVLNIFLAGILLSIAYLRTRSLWFATALHTGWNWMMGTVLALPVSGLALVNTPLYDGRELGPDWLTGGAFGPEGGLAATVAFLLALVVVLRVPLAEAARLRELRPLVDSRLPRS